MYQHGIMYTFGDDVKSQTVPKNYVFSPPYDSFTHIDTFMVVWKTNGSFNIKKIDYDFNGLILIDTTVYSVLKCRNIDNPNDTIIYNNPNDNHNRSKYNIYIPSVIKSNSLDNNRFYISCNVDYYIEYFRVYNRWGGLVWETHNSNNTEGWMSNNIGVYFYIIKVKINGEYFIYSGDITVIN